MTRHSSSGDASTSARRSSTYSEPPVQPGSVGSGSLGAPGQEAEDQRVSTDASPIWLSANRMASRTPSSPSGGSGTYASMSFSLHTTSCRSDSTSGRAMEAGTGVTAPTQWLDRDGVSTGTGSSTRRRSPATVA